jgi:agmatinase
VEFYDEELDSETYRYVGIATLASTDFTNTVDAAAVEKIREQTSALLNEGKFVVSLGAEHTVSLGFVQAHLEKYPNLSVLQIDAHSDLRAEYNGNPYSHASVMARVHDLGVPLVQVGIRAQCKEEADLRKSSSNIHTWYAHQLWNDDIWIDACIDKLSDEVYLTIDADGFDPSVCPAVGTAEPGGLSWMQGCKLFRRLAERKKVVGFDIVEIAPRETDIITEFSMAKLCYKIIGYLNLHNRI